MNSRFYYDGQSHSTVNLSYLIVIQMKSSSFDV